MQKNIYIYSRKLAIYLILKNHILIGLMNHNKNNNYKVFIFNDSERIRKNMNNYKDDIKFHNFYNLMSKGDTEYWRNQNAKIN